MEVPVQLRLYKSVKLWSFYVDLEESLGDLASTRRVYERILELRIATPQIIINYAVLLEVSPPRTADKSWEAGNLSVESGISFYKVSSFFRCVSDVETFFLEASSALLNEDSHSWVLLWACALLAHPKVA